ncbi:MAG: hypothetical protein M0P95_15465 [Sulfuritalea sp.]|nr:hypothetical protein [Sulfuritalea sp.]
MKTLLSTGVLLLSIAASNTALAQKALLAQGPPTISCGSYAEARIDEGTLGPNSIRIVSWVQGYLSGYNSYAKQPVVAVPTIAGIATFLDKYCADNPMHRVSNGIDSLLAELGGYKQPYLSK